MVNIIDQILEKLPKDAMISSTAYEGANIVLYTKNRSFFFHGSDTIRLLVDEFKKRIELRADSSVRKSQEDTEKFINELLKEESEITQILFEPARSIVTVESKKPGMVIGKDGENLRTIHNETLWTCIVRRDSIIPSKITKNIRKVLYDDSEFRRKFLNEVGERIYETKKSTVDEMWARISILGAGRQVGRSCFLLQTPESKVILDCGINVAATGKNSFPYLNVPEFHIKDLDAVVISHAHLDHSGFLPYLFKMGYRGPVYCTEATRDVMALLMLDYVELSHGINQDAIYNSNDVKETIKHTVCLDYGEVTDITPDVRLTLYNAGHIIGSSLCHLHLGEGWHNFMYTGDLKIKDTLLLQGAHNKFPRLETLMMESTYGAQDAVMPEREVCEQEILDIVKTVIKRKGKVILPTLGVGRAQEVMLLIDKLAKDLGQDIPVYIDGMVWDVIAIHSAYPRFMNKDVKEKIFYEDKDPFQNPMFKKVGSHKERMEIIEGPPCVIIATSGMLTGGPSVTYLKNLADNPKNAMLFTCFQASGSPGNRIQSGEKQIQMDTEVIDLKLDVHTIDGLSGHGDRHELMDYVKTLKPRPRKVLLVHGEQSRALDLASSMHKQFRIETMAPKNLDVVRLR